MTTPFSQWVTSMLMIGVVTSDGSALTEIPSCVPAEPAALTDVSWSA